MKTCKILTIFMLCNFMISTLSAQPVSKELLSDKWNLKMINNRDINEIFTYGAPPYIMFNFDTDQLSGNNGCNLFTGNFKYEDSTFEMPVFKNGSIDCPNKQMEETIMKILAAKSILSIMNGELIFTQDGKPVLVFTRAKPLTMDNLNGTWTLMSIEGKEAGKEFGNRLPNFQFNFSQNRITGNAGCNNFNAPFTLSKNVLDVQPLVTTRMSCEKMDAENKFVKLMTGRMDVDIVDGWLTFWKDNKKVMTFKK